jgi:flagellar biogenesis protein FliO
MESSTADASGADEKETQSGSGSAEGSASGTIYTFGFWLAVLFAALILVLVLIWVLVKVVGKNEEEANNTDLVYRSLQDARQIYAKMMK